MNFKRRYYSENHLNDLIWFYVSPYQVNFCSINLFHHCKQPFSPSINNRNTKHYINVDIFKHFSSVVSSSRMTRLWKHLLILIRLLRCALLQTFITSLKKAIRSFHLCNNLLHIKSNLLSPSSFFHTNAFHLSFPLEVFFSRWYVFSLKFFPSDPYPSWKVMSLIQYPSWYFFYCYVQ